MTNAKLALSSVHLTVFSFQLRFEARFSARDFYVGVDNIVLLHEGSETVAPSSSCPILEATVTPTPSPAVTETTGGNAIPAVTILRKSPVGK